MKKLLYIGLVLLLSGCYVDTKTIPQPLDYDFEYNGIAYNILTNSYNHYEVSVTASTKPNTYSGAIVIPSKVSYKGEYYTVDEIGYEAFYESSVYEITLPSSITEVQEYAFQYSQLKNLIISDSDLPLEVTYGFSDTPIETAYIGRSVSGIWENSTLNKLTLGESVKRFSIKLNQPLEIYSLSKVPPVLNIEAPEEVFNNSVVYVPAAAITDYEDSDSWKQFKIILVNEDK